MGKPIQKKWFTISGGSAAGDLAVLTQEGIEAIISQKGTGRYDVASGRVKLIDGVPNDPDEARLTHNGRTVWKLSQYRAYYFNDGDAGSADSDVWRDGAGNLIGTLVPAPVGEGSNPPAIARATANIVSSTVDSITMVDNGDGFTAGAPVVTISAPDGTSAVGGTATVANSTVTALSVSNGGSGYVSAPGVIISAPDGTSATSAEFVANTAGTPDADQSALIDAAGSGYVSAPTVSQAGGTGSGATFTATVTNGVVTAITASGGTDYDGTETVTISAVVLTQATATATINATGEVDSISMGVAGAGYVSATNSFDPVTLTQATATAVLSDNTVGSVTTDIKGAGYVAADVTIALPPT